MDYRDELDRMAKMHGYEERDDDPPCSECIHNPMCSGKNCQFERKYWPEELIPRYYHVNDFEDRIDVKLLNEKDMDEIRAEWPSDVEGPFFMLRHDWEKNHKPREYRVRVTREVVVEARDGMDAERKACTELCLDPEHESIELDILNQYRMPVEYFCCEEGRTYGYDYTFAANPREAQYSLLEHYCPDIESSPCPNDIEEYDPENNEWNGVYVRRITNE